MKVDIVEVVAELAAQRAFDAVHAGDDSDIIRAFRPVTILDTLANDLHEAQGWAAEYARRAEWNEYSSIANTRKAEKYAATARRISRTIDSIRRQIANTATTTAVSVG